MTSPILILVCLYQIMLEGEIVLAQATDDKTKSEQYFTAQLPYKYCGNTFSGKFHRPSCPFAVAISRRHLVLFHFRQEAIEAHFLPCRYCLPPVRLTVTAKILAKNPQRRNMPYIGELENRTEADPFHKH